MKSSIKTFFDNLMKIKVHTKNMCWRYAKNNHEFINTNEKILHIDAIMGSIYRN